jgi:hypothetical protein
LTSIFIFLYNFFVKIIFWRSCDETTDENHV